MADDLTPEQETARDRVHTLLAELAAEIGPEMDDDRTIVQPMLDQWVLVASWVDVATDEGYTTRIASRNLRSHTRTGLLHQALYQFGD